MAETRSKQVLVPITLAVNAPALAVIALPKALLASLNPTATQSQAVTMWNVQTDALRPGPPGAVRRP